ncbi:hypothetical protein [Pantoea sp.]|uniref:hypothetical protein n=1 Tax=Pantoea sp. TaxID=69393 RepID=UPI0028AFAB22|nr:hypothetical protein [Pantoea sp.]
MPVKNIYKVDWFQVLSDISRKGYSLQAIAEEVNVVPSTLMGWKKGSSPRHHTGEALIELWCRVTCKVRHDLPKEKVAQKFIFHPGNVLNR